jgi:Flp pilus assembly protein TadB
MSTTAAAISFALGLALLMLHLAPKPYKDVFAKPIAQRTLQEKMRQSLRLAGMFDQTPTFVLAGLAGVTVVLGFVLTVTFGTPFAAVIAVIVVPAAFHFALMSRQRRFMDRATNELIPFLNRMVTAVKAGKPAQSAYLTAVYESKELRAVLSDSAARISAGTPFRAALIETIPLFPLRMWSVFVRQLEAHDEMGGNLGDAIEGSVSQVNDILQLQAEARADYAAQDRQQKLIAVIALAGTAAFALMVDMSVISVLWTSILGFFVLLIALGVMSFGLWLSRKQLRDFERQASI